MGALSIALVFIIFWWIAWFIVLPFGIRTSENPEPGHAPSAPVRPRLLRKALIATAVAIVVTGIIVALVETGVLTLESFA